MEVIEKRKNVIMDSQIMSTLQGCARLTDFRFNRNLLPSIGRAKPLEKGSLVHVFMEYFYKGIKERLMRKDCIDQANAAMDEYIRSGGVINTPQEDIAEARKACNDYVDFRKNDAWTILEVEHTKGEVVYEDDEIRVLWKVKYDLIVDTNDDIISVDHKTMSRRGPTGTMSNQFMGQCVVLKSRKMLVNKIGFQKTLKPEEKFERAVINYSVDRLAEWIELVGYYARVLVAYNESGYWPPNFTHCDKYSGCMFRDDVCSVDRGMREEALKLHFVVGEPWDVEID